jgi:hypothetical protein
MPTIVPRFDSRTHTSVERAATRARTPLERAATRGRSSTRGQRPARGFTLVEIIVYAFLSLLILMMVFAVFKSGRDSYNTVTDTYLLGKQADAGLRSLREDLTDTALASIVLRDRPDGDTTLSMISARNAASGRFETTLYGAPKWQRYVFYTLAGDDKDGSLIRWEQPIATPTSPVPQPSSIDPDAPEGQTAPSRRTLFHGLYRPPQGELPGALPYRLRARFVRYRAISGSGASRQLTSAYTLSNPYTLDMAHLPDELASTQPVALLSLVLTVGSSTQGNQTRMLALPLFVSPHY